MAGLSAIEVATRRNERIFVIYIAVLVGTGMLIAFLTWLVWDAGNKVQDALRKDADARIQEARQGVEKLKNDNLILTESVARLQKDAADAMAAQQQVEVELANARRKQAEAERQLIDLQVKALPRGLHRDAIVRILKSAPPGKAKIEYVEGSPETSGLASNLRETLRIAGWDVPEQPAPIKSLARNGTEILDEIVIVARDFDNPPPYLTALRSALPASGFSSVGAIRDLSLAPDMVLILVGPKL